MTHLNIQRVLIGAIFFSLPFFSVRTDQGVSLTVVFLAVLVVYAAVRQLFSKERIRFFMLDYAHLFFLTIAAISTTYTTHERAFDALTLSIFYFSAYLAMRWCVAQVELQTAVRSAVVGIQIGVAGYFVLIAFAFATYGLPGSLDYHGITVHLGRSVASMMGVQEFETRDVLRNSMGEIFAICTVFPLVFYRQPRQLTQIFCGLAFVLVLLTFSRRAIIDVALVLVALGMLRGLSKVAWLAMIVMLAGSFYLAFSYGIESRLTNLDASSRFDQYRIVISEFQAFGVGYAATLPIGALGREAFVHNYWLANFHMLGIFGLLLSVWITYLLIRQIRKHRFGVLLLIPLVNMTVATAVQGIYTPAQWIVFAFCFAPVAALSAESRSSGRRKT